MAAVTCHAVIRIVLYTCLVSPQLPNPLLRTMYDVLLCEHVVCPRNKRHEDAQSWLLLFTYLDVHYH